MNTPIAQRSAFAAALILAGCGSAVPATLQTPSTATGMQTVSVRLAVPAAPNAQSTARRRPFFVAANTGGILVQTYLQSDTKHSNLLGQSATNITAGSTACGGQTSPRTCTFTISAPAGSDTFIITSYDGAPVNGSFSGKNQLAAAAINQTISASSNTINATLGGVLKTLQVVAPVGAIRGTVASSQDVIVEGFDTDGNLIASDGYVDASGNPLTVAMQVAPNTGNVFALASATLSAPSATGDALSYSGDAAAAFTATVTASTGTVSANATVKLLGPSFTGYATRAVNDGAGEITAVPGLNSLFFLEDIANKIGIVTTAGTVTELPLTGSDPSGIAYNPANRDLYYTAYGSSQIGIVDTTGAQLSTINTKTGSAGPLGITLGPDGNLWFTESLVAQIGVLNPTSGVVTEYPLTAGASPERIVPGSDGRLWFTEQGLNKIGAITTSGTLTEYTLPAGSSPVGIAAGADGNLWFTERAGSIGMITTSGAISVYSLHNAAVGLGDITAGPDGNLWFPENGVGQLGRLNIVTHVITEYKTPAADTFTGISTGPDGNIWFGDDNSSKVITFSW